MVGIRPATPGTIVVLAATVLLILVSVSTPLLKPIYFLEANLSSGDYSGTVRLGAWGYCVGDTCTSPKLGYSLNVAELLDINGRLSGISNSVLKWITYLMILHPIAAAFGVVSVIFGLLAHMRGFAGTALTTCFASFAATFSLLAFVFDIAVFVIAKQRIESSSVGGSAMLGPAVWMTLAAMVLFGLSGCFFGCGACVIRKQRAGREASEKNRPAPDEEYGSKLRGDALAAHERDKAYLAQNTQREGILPAFTEHERDREDIPLNSVQATAFEDDSTMYQPRHYPPPPRHMSTATGVGAPSLISGVGEGYGRRNNGPPGMPVSLTPESSYSNLPPPAPTGTPNNAGRGAGTGIGSRLAADARAQRGYATTEPFNGMHDGAPPLSSTSPPPVSNQGHYQSPSSYGHNDPNLLSTSTPVPMPVPQSVSFDPQPTSPTYHGVSPTYQGGYPAYPPAPPAALTPGGGAFGGGKQHYGQTSMPEPQLQQPPQQNYYIQNPSPSTHQTDPSISSHYNDQGLNPNHTGQGTLDRAPSTIAPTYYTYDEQQQQNQQGGSVNYHAPQQQQGSYGDQYGYDNSRRY